MPVCYMPCVRLDVIEIETYVSFNSLYSDSRQFSECVLCVTLCAHWFIQNIYISFIFQFCIHSIDNTLNYVLYYFVNIK